MASVIGNQSFVSSTSLTRPQTAWRWSQEWRDVFFLHWPAPLDWIRQQLPQDLELDIVDGQAWVSFVGFRLQNVRLRCWPALPFCSQMVELNFRTYVRYRDEPAICFLTMHADHRWMVEAARWLTPLPYALATLNYNTEGADCRFSCQPQASRSVLLRAQFRLGKACAAAEADSLDAWLTERYVAYVANAKGRLYRMAVWHEPWQLREIAVGHCDHNLEKLPGLLSRCHYSAGVSALLWPFEPVDG